jgi:hypothetical protein
MTKLLGLLVALALALTVAPAAQGGVAPGREQWIKDVNKVMRKSGAHLRERAAAAENGEKLAINLDIDNSSIATYYDGPDAGAIPRIRKFADVATSLGIALVFNTGRINTPAQRTRTIDQLTDAGYPVRLLCLRRQGETLPQSKQRCRDRFIRKGYTLVANVGNNPTDFTGDGYERRYRLPNYGGELG